MLSSQILTSLRLRGLTITIGSIEEKHKYREEHLER